MIQLIPQDDVQISFKSGSTTYGSPFFSTSNDYREDVPLMESVKKMEMGRNILKMDSYCFCRFYNLESITIPQYLNCTGGNGIFSMSQRLRFFVFPTSNTFVASYNFTESYALEGVSIPKSVVSINSRAFTACRNLKSITLHKELYRLQENCFNDCFSLEQVDVSYVTTFEKGVFQKCKVLREVDIPEGVTTYTDSMTADCYSIRKVVLPESIVSVDRYAFSNCFGLREIYFYPKTPPEISTTGVFMALGSKCKFYVPKGSLALYQSVEASLIFLRGKSILRG